MGFPGAGESGGGGGEPDGTRPRPMDDAKALNEGRIGDEGSGLPRPRPTPDEGGCGWGWGWGGGGASAASGMESKRDGPPPPPSPPPPPGKDDGDGAASSESGEQRPRARRGGAAAPEDRASRRQRSFADWKSFLWSSLSNHCCECRFFEKEKPENVECEAQRIFSEGIHAQSPCWNQHTE